MLSSHKVSFSIDRVGKYLLHVRLRQQARPMPGSPFGLVVKPGVAHHSATFLDPGKRPLRGEVGLAAENGCTMILQAHDRVGNRCDLGGANITMHHLSVDNKANLSTDVTSSVTDNGNGTYLLSWKSKTRGGFESKVMIGGEAVRGSPVRIELGSSVPEVGKTILEGAGLAKAISGVPRCVALLEVHRRPASTLDHGIDHE